jgi:hypothetical protein
MSYNRPVAHLHLPLWFLLEGQAVLHPVLIIPLWVVLSACAPLDSFRFTAASAVCTAQVKRFLSSNVSTRSEFHIILPGPGTDLGEHLIDIFDLPDTLI